MQKVKAKQQSLRPTNSSCATMRETLGRYWRQGLPLAWLRLGMALTVLLSLGAGPVPEGRVEINGHEIISLTARIGSLVPAQRAQLINQRLERLVADTKITAQDVTAKQETGEGWLVFGGNEILLAITDADAQAAGHTPAALAAYVVSEVRRLLEEERTARSPRGLMIGGAWAAGYTVLLALSLFGVIWLHRFAMRRLIKLRGTWVRSIRIKTLEILPASRIIAALTVLLAIWRALAVLCLLYLYIPLVLREFPRTKRHADTIFAYVLTPLRQVSGSIFDVVPNLLLIGVYVLLARYLLKVLNYIFAAIESGRLVFAGFYADWARPTYQIVRVLVIALTLAVVLPYIPGSSSAAFQGISVFFGILLSLGSTSAVANAVAGLVLTYMRPFRVGDRVEIGSSKGTVTGKTLLVTRLRTPWNIDITVPNAAVLANHIVNHSTHAAERGVVLHVEVTLGYDTPWRQVHELLLKAAEGSDGLLKEPAPFVWQVALENSYIRYQLNAYTREPEFMERIYSGLLQNLQDSFNRAGIEIMSPEYHSLRDGNARTIATVPRG